jgi:hypothetical protein
MRHCSRVVCIRLATWSRVSERFRMGGVSRRRLRHSFRFMLRSRRAFLSSVVSSAGALADNSSSEMSSRYQSSRVPEGPAVSPVAMKTWRLGVPRPESVLAPRLTYAPRLGPAVFPSGREVSRGRQRSMSCRMLGLRACDRASRRIFRQE